MHEIFDFADPDFISNSFAVLRPRLIIHLEATIVELERERDYSAKTRRLTAERPNVVATMPLNSMLSLQARERS